MSDTEIEALSAREILDNRLEPTLRVTVRTAGGTTGRADVPRGRSRGGHEATDKRDGGDRYRGLGVRDAVETVKTRIAPELRGRDVTDQAGIDASMGTLDGTADRSDLGGNAMTGVSLAVLKAGANAHDLPLYRYLGGPAATAIPVPVVDLIEGGELGASGLPFQEHQIVPRGAEDFAEAIRLCAEVYYELGDVLAERYGPGARSVGDEGGYTPSGLTDPREALDRLLEAIEACGYGGVFGLSIDAAATQLYDPDAERYRLADGTYTRGELIEYYADLASAYPLVSIEDPLVEDDFEGFAALSERLDAQIVGDDLFATNAGRIERGIDAGAGDALLCKVNQVGTVTETIAAVETARRGGYALQVSERSGQTADTWLADVAVGLGADQIKTGTTRSERTEQYNRLLEIADGSSGEYAEWPR
ncbi:phosphopyruvate hydratase [Natronomonas sp.]|uniref:phosphopyruvate hydratase n=1 Tax=Natronomonas sp. TaxID=2184060 RepID=UPI0026175701|nr:enolase C-terminal domain-like protein [Natronomonas sp.]